jgi:hypothetical protein
MGFFDSSQRYRYHDPYEYFNKYFGTEAAQLRNFFQQRLGRPDDAYTSAAGKLIRRKINESFGARRQATLRDLAGRGMAAGGRRNRLLADIEGQRGRALSDALSNLIIQRESQIPAMMSNFLAGMKMAPIQEARAKKTSTADKIMQAFEMTKQPAEVAQAFADMLLSFMGAGGTGGIDKGG